MENKEKKIQERYFLVLSKIPDVKKILENEKGHEDKLVKLIKEEKLEYTSSIVLGLNDALVEITGALAGLSLALQNTRLIGVVGLITGLSAALSMAASEYLSQKSETSGKNPSKAAVYTGAAYLIAVSLLVLPYFILSFYYVALILTLLVAMCIILFFSYFISVTKGFSFKRKFFEMLIVSFGVALISFFIGYVTRVLFGIRV